MHVLQPLPLLPALLSFLGFGFALLHGHFGLLVLFRQRPFRRRRFQLPKPICIADKKPAHRTRAKPAWVVKEVVRLAALSGEGCRSVEMLFNRLHAVRDNMTAGKSYVSYMLRKHRYEIELLRRNIKNKSPCPVPVNDT